MASVLVPRVVFWFNDLSLSVSNPIQLVSRSLQRVFQKLIFTAPHLLLCPFTLLLLFGSLWLFWFYFFLFLFCVLTVLWWLKVTSVYWIFCLCFSIFLSALFLCFTIFSIFVLVLGTDLLWNSLVNLNKPRKSQRSKLIILSLSLSLWFLFLALLFLFSGFHNLVPFFRFLHRFRLVLTFAFCFWPF